MNSTSTITPERTQAPPGNANLPIREFLRQPSDSPIRRLAFPGLALLALTLSAAEPKPPVAVRVAQPKHGDITRFVTLPGTVRANQQATLYAKVAGYLKTVAVDKGQAVQAGELLAEIEVPERLAELKRGEAEARVADIELHRLTEAQKKAPD